jgi:hypothetical protein
MGNMKCNAFSCLHQRMSEFKGVFSCNGKIIVYQLCGISAGTPHLPQITSYLIASKHIAAAVSLSNRPGRKSLNFSLLLQILLQVNPNFPLSY